MTTIVSAPAVSADVVPSDIRSEFSIIEHGRAGARPHVRVDVKPYGADTVLAGVDCVSIVIGRASMRLSIARASVLDLMDALASAIEQLPADEQLPVPVMRYSETEGEHPQNADCDSIGCLLVVSEDK